MFALLIYFVFFFFQAEDGIRDIGVTGVQTCALPIWGRLTGLTFSYLGDGANNMAHSYLLGGALAGMHVRVGSPETFQPDPAVLKRAAEIATDTGGSVQWTVDPAAAADGADVLVTDSWVSMGQEAEHSGRIAPFLPYAVDEAALARASG